MGSSEKLTAKDLSPLTLSELFTRIKPLGAKIESGQQLLETETPELQELVAEILRKHNQKLANIDNDYGGDKSDPDRTAEIDAWLAIAEPIVAHIVRKASLWNLKIGIMTDAKGVAVGGEGGAEIAAAAAAAADQARADFARELEPQITMLKAEQKQSQARIAELEAKLTTLREQLVTAQQIADQAVADKQKVATELEATRKRLLFDNLEEAVKEEFGKLADAVKSLERQRYDRTNFRLAVLALSKAIEYYKNEDYQSGIEHLLLTQKYIGNALLSPSSEANHITDSVKATNDQVERERDKSLWDTKKLKAIRDAIAAGRISGEDLENLEDLELLFFAYGAKPSNNTVKVINGYITALYSKYGN